MGINIVSTGKYLPKRVVTNDDLAGFVDTNDEWIKTRTGISERRVATAEHTYDMAYAAAKQALDASGLSPNDIDIVIASTITNDFATPSLACMVANMLEIDSNPFCMDVSGACAGFVYALDTARRFLDDDRKYALVISSEMLSKITDYQDRATCILFGDGAGACIISKAGKLYATFQGSDPSGVSKLFARSSPPANPFREKEYDRLSDGFVFTNGPAVYQDGKEVYKFATKIMPRAVRAACEKAGLEPTDLALVIPHQANLRILETAAKNLGIPMEKIFSNIHKYGNSSSACIPICLTEAIAEGKLKRGDKFCIVGFGAGLVYGATILEF